MRVKGGENFKEGVVRALNALGTMRMRTEHKLLLAFEALQASQQSVSVG